MNIEREYELESVYQSIKFVALGNDRYSDRIVSVPAFRLLCSSLIVFTLLCTISRRAWNRDYFRNRWLCCTTDRYFLLNMHFIDKRTREIVDFSTDFIDIKSGSNSILHYRGWISLWIREFFNFFVTFWIILKLIVLYNFSILLFVSIHRLWKRKISYRTK